MLMILAEHARRVAQQSNSFDAVKARLIETIMSAAQKGQCSCIVDYHDWTREVLLEIGKELRAAQYQLSILSPLQFKIDWGPNYAEERGEKDDDT